MVSVTASGAPGADPTPVTPAAMGQYVGLATRLIAFAIDAAIINVVALVVQVGAVLIFSIFHFPSQVRTIGLAVAAVAYVLWTLAYFVWFWSATGQTPGDRVLQIRVVTPDGDRFGARRAAVRCLGLILAVLPLCAGLLLILFDAKRRGFQDRFAGTVVVEAPDTSWARTRQARKLAAYRTARPGK